MHINTQIVESFFDSIPRTLVDRYVDYWGAMGAKRDHDFLSYGLFALLSVRMSMEKNIDAYKALCKFDWVDVEDISQRLESLRTGFHKTRAVAVDKYYQQFRDAVNELKKPDNMSWSDYRDKLTKIRGLGLAKSSFAVEIKYPLDCDVVCLDTHMLTFYTGAKNQPTPAPTIYKELERHWVRESRKRDIPPAIARHIYWDQTRNEQDHSRAWSHVLEPSYQVIGLTPDPTKYIIPV